MRGAQKGLVLKKLTFTGANAELAELNLTPGLNLIYPGFPR